MRSLQERLTAIRTKLKETGTTIGLALTESEVGRFEQDHGIELPLDYREFLLKVGNGCRGPPHYGLLRLGDLPQALSQQEAERAAMPDTLRTAFPFTRPWVWEAGEATEEGDDADVDRGILHLGTDGCGMCWALIVTGPDRGNVWLLTGEGICHTVPKRSFTQWFEDWLDGRTDWWDA